MPTKVVLSKPAGEVEDRRALADTIADATDAQIAAYVAANVVDLASARAYLVKLTKVVRTLARRVR